MSSCESHPEKSLAVGSSSRVICRKELRSRFSPARATKPLKPTPEIEKVLLEAIAQCERGDTLPMSQILRELRDRE